MRHLTPFEKRLAAALKDATPDDPKCTVAGSAARHGVHARCCKAIASALTSRSVQFDPEAFLRACGIRP